MGLKKYFLVNGIEENYILDVFLKITLLLLIYCVISLCQIPSKS
jgi:hypothetical protein